MAPATWRSATRASLLDPHPLDRVDVGLAGALGGHAHGELAGPVPRPAALLAEEPGDVAEQRHPLERVPEWTVVSHEGIVGRCHPIDLGPRWWSSRARHPRWAGGSPPWRPRIPPSAGSSPSTGGPRRRSIGCRGPPRGPGRGRPQAAPRGGNVGRPPGPGQRARDVAGQGLGDGALARRVLEAASAVGAEHVVLSRAPSSTALGEQPVPITEDAPLRPNPGVTVASEKAELERTAAEWRDAHPVATVASCAPPSPSRPMATAGWPALRRSSSLPVTDEEPPAQFLDVDDLAAAVDLARRARLDGPRNVAPDGWISGDTVARSPVGAQGAAPRAGCPPPGRPRLAMAPRAHAAFAAPVHGAPVGDRQRPPEGRRLAADQLQRGGLRRRPPGEPWATLSPRRRQELALGAVGVAVAGSWASPSGARPRRRTPGTPAGGELARQSPGGTAKALGAATPAQQAGSWSMVTSAL